MAFAQEAPTQPTQAPAPDAPTITMTPPVATPPTVAQPNTTAPIAVPQTAQPTTPRPVIQVPLDLPPAPAEAAPATAERAAPQRTARTARTAARPAERAAPTRSAPAPVAAAPAAAEPAEVAPVASEIAPVAAPVTAAATPVADPAPRAADTATADNSFPWELAGGAAALLLAGGVGLAFARRRRSDHAVADEGMSLEQMAAAEAVPYSPPREDVAPMPQPAMRSTPSFAAAPSGSMGRHEAMALAGPTPDNPFATLKKRLQRARFLDRQERVAYDATLAEQKDMSRKPVSAWEIAQRPAPVVQQQDVRRPEPARARTTFRPGFSNN
ncbi:MAG: hypothetical protein HEQ22_10175 [Sphingopyxis sp.]|uniref:hypothetical protein n=1 Tax=Sphingopyxis sp. TaxID=1908224 RepID=UPI003D810A05